MTLIIARYERQATEIARLRSLPADAWVWTPMESTAEHLQRRARERGVRTRFTIIRVGSWGLEVAA